jgi:hypothetical protein
MHYVYNIGTFCLIHPRKLVYGLSRSAGLCAAAQSGLRFDPEEQVSLEGKGLPGCSYWLKTAVILLGRLGGG